MKEKTKNYNKTYITRENHQKIVDIAKYFGFYYDTEKGVLWMHNSENKRVPYRILSLKGNIYFQYKLEQPKSLESFINHVIFFQKGIAENMKNLEKVLQD